MTIERINGVKIRYERRGSGPVALVLVHGSWGSHHNWDLLAPLLARSFTVVTYDRRGHSESERPPGRGSVHQDVADLGALIEHLGLAPAWVVGNSFGSIITLRLAATRPELLRGIITHEPPLIALIADDPEAGPLAHEASKRVAAVVENLAAGDDVAGAKLFVETVALGIGMWTRIPEGMRQTFIQNGPTYLDECRDPDQLTMDLGTLGPFRKPALVTIGDQSPAMFPPIARMVAAAIPGAEMVIFPGAGHIPHTTHPERLAEAITAFVSKAAGTGARRT